MNADELRRYLEFYEDLGVKTLYRRQSASAAVPEPAPGIVAPPPPPPTRMEPPPLILPSLEPDNDSMLKIIEDIGDCRRCRLSQGRNKIVFGVGNPEAPLVFVGEASYCLYLLHFNLWNLLHGSHVLEVLGLSRFDPWVSYVLLIALAILALHFIEKPVQRKLRQWMGVVPVAKGRLAGA